MSGKMKPASLLRRRSFFSSSPSAAASLARSSSAHKVSEFYIWFLFYDVYAAQENKKLNLTHIHILWHLCLSLGTIFGFIKSWDTEEIRKPRAKKYPKNRLIHSMLIYLDCGEDGGLFLAVGSFLGVLYKPELSEGLKSKERQP